MSAMGGDESEVHVVLRCPQQDPEPTEARQLVDEPPVALVEPVEVVEPDLVGRGGRECTCALTIASGITVTTYLVGLLLSATTQDRYTMAFATLPSSLRLLSASMPGVMCATRVGASCAWARG